MNGQVRNRSGRTSAERASPGRTGAEWTSAGCIGEAFGVSRETMERFEIYRQLLERWQEKVNLVSAPSLGDFWRRHVADSLQLLDHAPARGFFVDLGSGAGFPGLALAIAKIDSGNCRHVLIESNRRKCAFLRRAASETGAAVEILDERIERAVPHLARSAPLPDLVSARALAPLKRLLELAEPLLGEANKGVFHKGRGYKREIAELHGARRFELIEHSSRVESGAILLEARRRRRRASAGSGSAPKRGGGALKG